MDRHKIQTNRHKKKEEFKSGSAKRKIAKEKEKKNEEVIAKSRRMTDYMKFKPSSSAAPKNNDHETRSPTTSLSQPQNFEDGEVVSSIKIIIKVVERLGRNRFPLLLIEISEKKFNVIIIVKNHAKVVFGKLVVQKELFLVYIYFSFRLVIDNKLKL